MEQSFLYNAHSQVNLYREKQIFYDKLSDAGISYSDRHKFFFQKS